MLDFIPSKYYAILYYNILLLIVLLTVGHTLNNSGFRKKTYKFNKTFAIILFSFLLIYMGLRPISIYFGDMGSYARLFNDYAAGYTILKSSDIAFYTLMEWLALFNNVYLFFFVMTLLYITPLYIAVRRWFPNYYYLAFLILVTSFSFWSYGTNGIRNGIATSLMILALSYQDKKLIMYALFALAYGFHSSMLLIIVLYFLSGFIKNISFYFYFWGSSIFLSLLMGSFWENFFASLGFGDEDKINIYFFNKEEFASQFSSTGFRWDFLLYSFTAVFASWYFINKLHFKDKYYLKMVQIYLMANGFWILVIRANFSNRFAYLSWFMMGIIIIYPLLKQVYWKKQFQIIGILILTYFSFTYIMNIIIY